VVVPFPAPVAGRAKVFAKNAKILCDTMVQGLGKYMRKLGIDTKLLMNPVQHSYCVRVALMENRFVVTRGKSYLEARTEFSYWEKINKVFQFASQLPPGQVINISSQQVEQQVDEVLKYFNIQVEQSDIFSRCMVIIFN
jgi:uncharacterized protein with PIN domain